LIIINQTARNGPPERVISVEPALAHRQLRREGHAL
jgi:hypothetical protein